MAGGWFSDDKDTEDKQFSAGDLSAHNAAEQQAAADYDAQVGSDSHAHDITEASAGAASAYDDVTGDE